jgi:hypothetical protein
MPLKQFVVSVKQFVAKLAHWVVLNEHEYGLFVEDLKKYARAGQKFKKLLQAVFNLQGGENVGT